MCECGEGSEARGDLGASAEDVDTVGAWCSGRHVLSPSPSVGEECEVAFDPEGGGAMASLVNL
jgi:hypothetical protein